MGKILETNNYGLFVTNALNRKLKRIKSKEEALRKFGWLESKPLVCRRQEDGRLLVLDGHTRLEAAKRIGCFVRYIEDRSEAQIFDFVTINVPWSPKDFGDGYDRDGNANYAAVNEYVEKTGIPLSVSVSLLAGKPAGAGKLMEAFKRGDFKLEKRSRHAADVAEIVTALRSAGFEHATSVGLVRAISKALCVPAFDRERMVAKIKKHGHIARKQNSDEDYLEMLEEIYNRTCPANKVFPLKFESIQEAKKRQKIGMELGRTPRDGRQKFMPGLLS